MKKNISFVCAAGLLLCSFGAFAKSKKPSAPYVIEEFAPDKVNRQLGYQLTGDGSTVVFVFDAGAYGIKVPKKVYVEGSFNGWAKGTSADWQLEPYKRYIWTLMCDAEDVKVPGNSIFPEFKFYIVADV